jgi:hypothetical protein
MIFLEGKDFGLSPYFALKEKNMDEKTHHAIDELN